MANTPNVVALRSLTLLIFGDHSREINFKNLHTLLGSATKVEKLISLHNLVFTNSNGNFTIYFMSEADMLKFLKLLVQEKIIC